MEFLAIAGQTTLIAGVVGWVDLTTSTVDEDIAKPRAAPGGQSWSASDTWSKAKPLCC